MPLNPLSFWLLIGALSIFLILKSASYALGSIVRYAHKTKLSQYFVGLLIVSIGTSLPELFTGIIASLEGKTSLVLGDAMGATIVDIVFVLAMVAIVAGRLKIKDSGIDISWWKVIIIVALPLFLAIDGTLSRIDGIILLLAFIVYYGLTIYAEIKKQKMVKTVPYNFVFRETFIFGVNIALLIFGAQLMVASSINLSKILNIPEYLFGAIFLSALTTLPELTVEIKAIMTESAPIAFGDIFGSVVCNISLVLGIAILIHPITIHALFFYTVGLFMIISTITALWAMRKKFLLRKHGLMLIGIYALYLIVQIAYLTSKGIF